MKKSLVLAMAMALGVTASAYAANPFSDVPAGHWAYDSISKLAAAGVIEGYGDDTFRGDRLMTRYEMAQIVAKAMAKGANVNKLAAEFADELDALGVRVAALEKKADNVKINGQIRWRWRLGSGPSANGGRRRNHDLRTRLWFNGQINENWKYIGMIENTQDFMNDQGDESGNNIFTYQRAYVEGRLGGVKVTAGRYHEELVGGDSDVYSHRIDGVKLKYGFGKANLMGYYGKLTAAPANARPRGYGIHADVDLAKKVNLFVGYDALGKGTRPIAPAAETDRKLFDVGLKAGFGDFGLTAIYLHGSRDNGANTDKKNGWTLEAKYKGANAAKPGSWGIIAKYYDQGNLTYWAHGAFTGKGGFQPNNVSGFKGFRIGGEYTVAKNMIGRVNYFDLKAKDAGNAAKVKTIYTEMIMTF